MLAWAFCLAAGTASIPAAVPPDHIDLVRVVKSERRLYLTSNGRIVAAYQVALGRHPLGAKQQQGDGKTPEGRYVLDYRNAHSAFYRAFHISYPDATDLAEARRRGVKPGGMITLHGQKNGLGRKRAISQRLDLTDGCIAVSNADMDQLWRRIEVPTPIQIDP